MSETRDIGGLGVGNDRLENGRGVVIVKLGPLVYHVDPPTARGLAIALIHNAEVAGMPPPTEVEMGDLFDPPEALPVE